MDEVAAEFGGDFNAEDAECTEEEGGATVRSYCAGKARVIASAQDAAALVEWPRLRGPDTVIAELLRINPEKPEQDLLRYTAEKLTRGCVVAIPTDTLYGLAADPFNLAAVDEIYRVKGRPEARALTIVVDASHQVPLKVSTNTKRVALRWPKNEVVTKLIEEFRGPITGTSANISGYPSCSSAEEVMEQLGKRLPLVIDTGDTKASLPSTIVELHGREWRIGREGAITEAEIDDALGGEGGVA